MSMADLFLGAIFFIFGGVFGSFLNVCIYRFPREESIVKPGSHCPHCQKPISWKDNLPILSYILLRGRCRSCGQSISARYFWVELMSGLIWITFWSWYGFSGVTLAGILLYSVLLSVSVTDWETGYIPDKFTLPTMAAGLILSAGFPELQGQGVWLKSLGWSFAGLLAGGGILLVTGLIGNFLFKKDSMGGGDIKLLAMLGAFLGVKKVILVFLLAPILAVPFALFARFIRKSETIPFGPYLALTGAWLFLHGDRVAEYLFHL